MASRKNKIKIGCGIVSGIVFIVLIGLFVYIYSEFSKLSEAFKSVDHTTAIEFKDSEQTVFITTREWGITGNHHQIVISNIDHANKDILINREKEIVFDETSCLYYKAVYPDSLFVFVLLYPYVEENVVINKEVGHIKVNITKYKLSMDGYYANYKELGLSLICCNSDTK